MDGNRSSRRTLMVEVLAIDLVVSCEVIHVDEKGRYLGNVAQIGSGTGQNVAHVLDHRAGLRTDVEARRTKLIAVGSGDGVVWTAGTCPRDEQEIPGAFYVRIWAARGRFRFQHGSLRCGARLHHLSCDVRIEYKCCLARSRSSGNACRLHGRYRKAPLLRTACAGHARTSNSPK